MVDGVNGASGSGSTLDTQRKTIADNFDTFLQLLTTQLRNQNPLDPMDTNQFTQQLVQFTSVEQQLKTNQFLEAMMLSTQNNTNTQAVALVGKTVTASGATTDLVDGRAAWLYRIDQPAENTRVVVRDENGNEVYSEKLSLEAGTDYIVWDGTTTTGQKLTGGKYTITIDARDSQGRYVAVTTEMQGIVSGVDVSGREPYLMIGGMRIPLSAVSSISETKPPQESPEPEDSQKPEEPQEAA